MSAIKILETNVMHASDIIYWLNGASAENAADMQRLPHAIEIEFTNKPSDLKFRHAPGKTACWLSNESEIIDGIATDENKTFTGSASYTLSGTVFDPKSFYNPRTFSFSAGASSPPIAGHGLVLYPTPLGARFGKAGGLIATLRFSGDGAIVPWALLTVTVTIPGGSPQIYRAQADHRGDVMISLQRLPPLPEGVSQYSATMSIRALSTASPDTPLDTNDLVDMNLESLTTVDSFSNPIGFNVAPGEIQLIRSADKEHLTVQSS